MISIEKARQLRALIEKAAASLSDSDALDGVELFPTWATSMDYAIGDRVRYDGWLYKVLQAHTSQADWTPDITTSLFAEVEKPGQGDTPDNPIPYNNNMELFENKYYSQDGVTYRCFRSTGTPVYNPLSALIGLYVEVVS